MKTRTKILITILLAVGAVLLQWAHDGYVDKARHARLGKPCLALNMWYDEFNDEYFENDLPKNVVIDYGITGNEDEIAATSQLPDGRFHIAFNEDYARAPRVAHVFLIHEMCHIKTWGEIAEHGSRWRTCMLVVDAEGAHRSQLIDGYTNQN